MPHQKHNNYHFKKGVSGNPNGRPAGAKNKNSAAIQKAYVDLINNNLHNIQTWLDRVAIQNPYKALDVLIKLSPFVIPKKMDIEVDTINPITIVIPKDDEPVSSSTSLQEPLS